MSELLNELFESITEYEKRGGKVLLWFCPNECRGQVEFIGAGKEYIGVCKVCQTTSVETLRNRIQCLEETISADQNLKRLLLEELDRWRDGKLALQKEYDEFRRVALMLTTEESISFMRGKK